MDSRYILISEDFGKTMQPLPKALRKKIVEETDAKVLEQWLKIAASVKSIEEFQEAVKLF